jgi:hypothetical protein
LADCCGIHPDYPWEFTNLCAFAYIHYYLNFSEIQRSFSKI